ncbi:MAG: EAL domain-containing protein [Betaproteobacteria bacterium]|nr:EAL domain-containing protein [Betaproteobacteria bacterium]
MSNEDPTVRRSDAAPDPPGPAIAPAQPLRRAILLRVTLLKVGTALLVAAGFSLFGLLPLSKRISQSQFNIAASQVEARLDATFAAAASLTNMSRGWFAHATPSLEDPAEFNRLFMPVLTALPQVTSVVAGTSDGQGWLLLRQPEGRWRNRMTDVARHGKRQQFFDHTAEGGVKVEWREVDYDARRRPWFAAALQGADAHGPHWTAPYVFFTTGDPGITASTRIRHRDSRDFVIGFDLMLRDLSLSTMRARVGTQGLALVVTADNRVLALPAPPGGTAEAEWLKRVLKAPAELGLAPVDAALTEWQRGGRVDVASFEFESGGRGWLGGVRAYPLGTQRFHVLTLAPTSDFAPAWPTLAVVLLAAMLPVAGVAFLIVRAHARTIAQPLEQLAAASRRIGQLDFTPARVDSSLAEVRELAAAQDAMRALLETNHRQLDEQTRLLNNQINTLRATEARLRDSEAYNKVLFNDSPIPLVVLDPATNQLVDCNQAALAVYGLPDRESLLSCGPADVSVPVQYDGTPSVEAAERHVTRALAEGVCIYEWRHRRRDGSEWDAEIHLMRFNHAGRTLLQFSVQDITAKKAAAGKIAQLAYYDTLTGLPNRRLLTDRLHQALASSARSGNKGALLFIDLDDFKTLNDTHGHDQGDLLLRQVAVRLTECVRESDSVGRFGGDEFLVMLENLHADPLQAAAQTEAIGAKILEALSRPYDLLGREQISTPSIGGTLFAEPGDTVDELLKRADVAMYQAKAAGRNAMRFYDPRIQAEIAGRKALEGELRMAARRDQLVLHYQVQVDGEGHTLGAEALVRWPHATRGLLMPAAFIGLAEESGLIVEVGHCVLRLACRRLAEWAQDPQRSAWRLSVNVSSRQFRHPSFVQQVRDALDAASADPHRLRLELTESMLAEDVGAVAAKMNVLRDLGITFALDDFGTGFSSLGYLKRLPLDELKIDQTFVRDLLTDPNDAAIACAVITLARSLGLAVIAEGVETEAQRDYLASQGCHAYQGYLFGRPAETV